MRPGAANPPAARTAITRTRIIDGAGGPEYLGDIILEGGSITEILAPGGFQDDGSTVVIDGAGLVTCPGFIDLQGTSGIAPLLDPPRHGALTQGVTTEAAGWAGPVCAPLTTDSAAALQRELTETTRDWTDQGVQWRTVGQYLDRVDEGTGTNIAYLVPLDAVRTMAGSAIPTEPTAEQLVTEVKALADALEQGAFGLCSPLAGSPNGCAGNTEIEALCAAVAAYDGHWAAFPVSAAGPEIETLSRSMDLAATTGVRLHLGDICATDQLLPELLALLDDSEATHPHLSCGSHPYLQSQGTLLSLLPGWARAGRPTEILERLEDADTVAQIRAELEAAGTIDWAAVTIAEVESGRLTILVGQDIGRIAAIQSADPVITVVRILCTDALATTILHRTGSEESLHEISAHRTHVGTGTGSVSSQHPGIWGAFARYVGREARDAELMDLPSVIHQLTARPAAVLNLSNRGVLSVGRAADVLVFDADAIIDMATFADPRQPAAGIHYVFVNGVPAVSAHLPTSALAGRALRRGPEGTTKTP